MSWRGGRQGGGRKEGRSWQGPGREVAGRRQGGGREETGARGGGRVELRCRQGAGCQEAEVVRFWQRLSGSGQESRWFAPWVKLCFRRWFAKAAYLWFNCPDFTREFF